MTFSPLTHTPKKHGEFGFGNFDATQANVVYASLSVKYQGCEKIFDVSYALL